MAKWLVYSKRADFEKIAETFSISPMMARILRNRDLVSEEEIRRFLTGTVDDLYPTALLKDLQEGVLCIQEKIRQKKKIRIIGDYDVDGICASYILKTGLRICGGEVDVAIPHRIRDGYGINEALILEAYEAGIDTIITCDNGISAFDQINYAKELGMTVIVTDHHEVPYEDTEQGRTYFLPPADRVIDPKQEACEYPFKSICGAVVAYKFVEACFLLFQIEKNQLEELLEFACIATVGDVMPLLDENRILVKEGLAKIEKSKNVGIRALLRVTGLEGKKISPYHLGFIICPCLNATGRLDTALRALSLFEEKEETKAITLAGELKSLNDSRKEMTQKGVDAACRILEESKMEEDKVLVLYLPDCHESLAGIIAGRIREHYGKPTFVLTDAEDGVKGSGRSIEAYSMYEAMVEHRDLFLKFGGHKLAAGLSLEKNKIEEFRKCMNESATLCEDDFQEKIRIDIPMPLSYATMDFIKEMELLEPYGVANPRPLFAQRDIYFVQAKVMGQNKNVIKIKIEDEEGNDYEAISFSDSDRFKQRIANKYGEAQAVALLQGQKVRLRHSVVYSPEINEFRGNQSIQYVIKDYE